jgi:type II secretory pathway predicted ATPase ExeA
MNQDQDRIFKDILYAIKNKKLIILSGPHGTGKTILIHNVIEHLPASVSPVVISGAQLETTGLIREVAQALGVHRMDNLLELHEIENALTKLDRQQKHLVLIVDDAHLLPDRDLREIGLFRMVEQNDQQLLSILLVGQGSRPFKVDHQPGGDNSKHHSLKFRMPSLNEADTINYIDYRLQQVGSSFNACFEPDTRDLIFEISAGVPLRINQVCGQALQLGMEAKLKKVNRRILEKMRHGEPPDLQFTHDNKGLSKPIVSLILGVMIILGALASFNGVLGHWWQQNFAKIGAVAPTCQDNPVKGLNQEKAPAKTTKNPVRQKILSPRIVAENLNTKNITGSQGPEIDRRSAAPKSEVEETESITQRVVRPQENLTKIVAEHYQEYEPIGYAAVILANPDITNENLITPGEVLYLPVINYRDEEIRLPDNLFYSPYRIYYSAINLQKDVAWLTAKKVRYLVRQTRQLNGIMVHRVYLGGYETRNDLQQAKRQVHMASK